MIKFRVSKIGSST